jgi:aryl-alcohol dehydrogenase-like predicted oxidoreductase
MPLATRTLGLGGPEVTKIGFGAMGISAFYGTKQSDAERLKVLDHIYKAGEWFWDTSDAYGDSEDLIGQRFQKNPEKRKDIILATKFGNLGDGLARNDGSYVHQACAKSLKRLQTSYIDLYYVHRIDPATPIEHTVQAMLELKEWASLLATPLQATS